MARPLVFIAVPLLLLCGCQTTGDPRSGGLFGWSEEKAVARQQNLKDKINLLHQDTDANRQTTPSLEEKRENTAGTIDDIQKAIKQLRSENRQLEERLKQLRQTNSSDLDLLEKKQQQRDALPKAEAISSPRLSAIERQGQELERLQQQNDEYKKAIELYILN